MRFMMIVKAGADYEAGKPPSPALMAAIAELSEEARRSGKLQLTEGLKPTRAGAQIRLEKGKRYVVDGPFAETKEVIGGFAIFELSSREEAMAMAQRFVDAHVKAGVADMALEIRQLYGPEDVGGCADVARSVEHA